MIFKKLNQVFAFFPRNFSQIHVKNHKNGNVLENCPVYMEFSKQFHENNEEFARKLMETMTVHPNFISCEEERNILNEIEPYMKRLRYEYDHWDDAIHGYRETERLKWNEENMKILNKVRELAFPESMEQLEHVHILDLSKDGYIKPHIDAVKFCGNTIAGLSLLSDSVMRLVHATNKELYINIMLERRSLYIMKDTARFDFTHEILKNPDSIFKEQAIVKDRRISVICRNKPC